MKWGRYTQDVHIKIHGKEFITDFVEFNDMDSDILLPYLLLVKYEPFILRRTQISLHHKDEVKTPILNVVTYSLEGLGKNSTKEWAKEVLEDKNEKELAQIREKFEKDCCSMNPLEFWSGKQEECEIKIRLECMSIIPHEPAYLLSPTEVKEMDEHLNELLEGNFIRESKSPFVCTSFLVNKRAERERGKNRFCINYKRLNDIILPFNYPIPFNSDLIRRVANKQIFPKFDCKSRFWQIKVKEEDKYKMTFSVQQGLFE